MMGHKQCHFVQLGFSLHTRNWYGSGFLWLLRLEKEKSKRENILHSPPTSVYVKHVERGESIAHTSSSLHTRTRIR